jgi:glutamate/aspartate transport system substrate-binding protein
MWSQSDAGEQTMVYAAKAIAAFCVALLAGGAAHAAEGLTLQKIELTGAIAIGYRDGAIPFSYLDADNRPAGFAIELCSIVAEKVKQTLGMPEIRVNYKPETPADRAALIRRGMVDLDCGAAPETAELARDAAFSRPIYISQLKWLAPKQLRIEIEGYRRRRYEMKALSSSDDLKGKTVALTQGSAATPVILAMSVERYLGLSIVHGKDPADAFKLVEQGKAEAVMDDDASLLALKAGAKNPDAYALLDSGYAGGAYALAMRKDDPAFKALVDDAIAGAMRSGEFEKLYAKWFENPIPPKNVALAHPMSAALKQLVKAAGGASN